MMGHAVDGTGNGSHSDGLSAGAAILLAGLKLSSTCVAKHSVPRSTLYILVIHISSTPEVVSLAWKQEGSSFVLLRPPLCPLWLSFRIKSQQAGNETSGRTRK